MENGHVTQTAQWTSSMEMHHGHEPWTGSTDMKHGPAACISSMNMQVSISKTNSMDMQQGHDKQDGHEPKAWKCSIDMGLRLDPQDGYAA